ncbi:MAG TPA: hypothetical protein VK776_19275 [Bryobacteraceae bacterium]|jgi:hypothetical protein|nr:hypothetical protein [Bryobacteraceae bacterium]
MQATSSRRNFLKLCATAHSAGNALSEQWQRQQNEAQRLKFTLAKEIKGAFYRAISPDSQKLCIGFMRKPIGKITITSQGSQRDVHYQASAGFTLVVLGVGDWREIYSVERPGMPGAISFFLDGEALYASSSTFQPITEHLLVLDLRTGGMEQREWAFDGRTSADYYALWERVLIGVRGQSTQRPHLVQVRWPDLTELVGIPLEGWAGGPRMTVDRKKLIHPVGQRLVCRRAEDFDVLWTRQVDPEIDLKARMKWNDPEKAPHLSSTAYAVSADGSTVALAPQGTTSEQAPRRFYTEILDGESGAPRARWPLDFGDGIVLSPDGKLLALAEVADDRSGQLEPTAHIYAVPSGTEVTRVVHDQVPRNQRLNASLSEGMEFTPDGRYFITSANNKVKIWKVGQEP